MSKKAAVERVTFIPGTKVRVVGHPAFTGTGMVTARPSPDAAIIELESGERERIAVRYLEELGTNSAKEASVCSHKWQYYWTEEGKVVDCCSRCAQTKPPTLQSLEAALKDCIEARDDYQQTADSGQRVKECLKAVESKNRQIQWLEEQLQQQVETSKPKIGSKSDTSLSTSNNGMKVETVPARSLVTDGGTEPNLIKVSAMDNSTINSTDYAALELELGEYPQAETSLTPAIEFELLEELSFDEERERLRLERKVENCVLTAEKTFYEMGKALTELRDRRLYRSTHKNFSSYCNDRFHAISRRKAEYLIVASEIVDDLKNANNCSQILPTAESQVRALSSLAPEKRPVAWVKAVEQSEGKVPTAKTVKGIVETLKEKPLTLASEFCQVGDIFTLHRLEGAERKYNGCSCVACELKDFTVMVNTYHETIAVKPENLKKIDSPDARRELPQVLERIRRLRSQPEFLDRVAYTVLDHMGRQVYLTPLEEKLLRTIEEEYGVKNNTIK